MGKLWSRIRKSPLGWVLAIIAGAEAIWSRYLDYRDTVALGLSPEFWLGAGLLLFFVAVLVIVYQFQKQTEAVVINIGNPSELKQQTVTAEPSSYFQNQKILICELARDELTIRNKIFEDCELIGPAMILLTGSAGLMAHSSFEGSFEKTVIVVQEGRFLVGAVAFEDCVFRRCKFLKVGIIAIASQEEMFRKGFGVDKQGSN